MPFSNDSFAVHPAKTSRDVVSLHQGGAHLTLRSRSRFVAFRMSAPNSSHNSRLPPPFSLNVPALTSCTTAKRTLTGLVVRGDIKKSFAAPLPASHWRTMAEWAAQMTFVLPREALLSIPGDIGVQLDRTLEPTRQRRRQTPVSLQERTSHIPHIIITPPDDSSTTLNSVPTPQNAAFGMQLTVPDPEFRVINPQNPFSDYFVIEDRSTDPSSDDGDIDSERDDSDRTPGLSPAKEEDGDNDASLDLGHTWSG